MIWARGGAKWMGPACVLLLFLLTSWGWGDKGLEIQVRFEKIKGLAAEHGVFFEDRNIGRVKKVAFGPDGKYRVDLFIRKDFANAADTETFFVIKSNPENKKEPAVWLFRGPTLGTPLEDGAVVQGSGLFSWFFSQMEDRLGKALAGLSVKAQDLFQDLDNLLNKKQIEKLQKILDKMAQELARSGQEAKDRFKNEVLPGLREKMADLQKRLKALKREKEAEPLQRRLDELQAI